MSSPVREARSWLPIIGGVAAVLLSAACYNLHSRHELFAFISVIASAIMLVIFYSNMSDIPSLNVYALLAVYLLWLIRGTMIRPGHNSPFIISNEIIGMVVSVLLIMVVLTTFIDRRMMSSQLQFILVTSYVVLLVFPHACSLSYGLRWWQLGLRTISFSIIWLLEDYAYAIRFRKAESWKAMWWFNRAFQCDYVTLMMRSVWLLFVHDVFLLITPIVLIAWTVEVGILSVPKVTAQPAEDMLYQTSSPPRTHQHSPPIDVEDIESAAPQGEVVVYQQNDQLQTLERRLSEMVTNAVTKATQEMMKSQQRASLPLPPPPSAALPVQEAVQISTLPPPIMPKPMQRNVVAAAAAAAAAPPPAKPVSKSTPKLFSSGAIGSPKPSSRSVASTPVIIGSSKTTNRSTTSSVIIGAKKAD